MGEYEISNAKKLFSCAMKGEWDNVIKFYQEDATLHKARITLSGQTALHIAVSDGKENVVEQMLHVMSQKDQRELVRALRTPNHRGNTALHLAASIGNATICHIIASVEYTLVDDRNDDGETPLFLAALHGRKQAFLCLHYIRNPNITTTPPPSYVNCRRNNGDTILHCAINGDYFDLAFQIIHLYNDLANWVNEEGLSPLHLLASKSRAFKSGSRLRGIETITYHCIYVEKLKAENPAHEHQTRPISAAKDSDSHDCPDNYNTLWDVFCLIRKAITVVLLRKPDADEENPRTGGRANPSVPVNYATCCNWIRFFYLVLLTISGEGSEKLRNIYRKKETHTWSVQIVKELLRCASLYEYQNHGRNPQEDEFEGYNTLYEDPYVKEGEKLPKKRTMETPILVAAKNGVVEIIEKIVEVFPLAFQDLNEDKKNIVLLAVEHRQPHVYEFLMKKNIYRESLFHQVDKDGNSALHLAATFGGDYKPWFIPGDALQMQWEYKWYKFVKDTMPHDYSGRYNMMNETPAAVFTRTHRKLAISAVEWLNKIADSCSVTSVIATVAFATAATVPGGVKQDTGVPTLEDMPEFQLFAIAALMALVFSITAMVMFLSIFISRFQEQDFDKNLPRKLLVGLTSSVMSIACMLVSFCAGHFFVLKDKLHYLVLPIYAASCLPVTLFLLTQFPGYLDLLWATFAHVPQRSYRPS